MPFDIQALQKASLQPPQAQTTDLARYILTHANVDWSKASNLTPTQTKKPGSPSVLSRIFDLMSRPSYAVDEMARRFIQHEGTSNNPQTGEQVPINPGKHNQNFLHEIGDILHGGASGLAGTQKTTWAKTLTELNPKGNAAARYGGGFLLDLLTDPTTYIGPGIAKSVIRGARGIISGGKTLKEGIPEAKGIINVIQGTPKVPAVVPGSQGLPESLSRASSQVRVPDFHAPGMVVSPKNSFPKLNLNEKSRIPTAEEALLSQEHYANHLSRTEMPLPVQKEFPAASELAKHVTQLDPKQIEALSSAGSRKTAQILGQIYREKGYNVDVRGMEKILSNLPMESAATKLPKIKLSDAHRALNVGRGDLLRAAEEISAYYKRRGFNIDTPKLQNILESTPKNKILELMQKSDFPLLDTPKNTPNLLQDYIREAKNAPVYAKGLKAQQESKALSLEKLQKGAAKTRPMINSRLGVNVERAGDIVDKIAQGDYNKLIKPPVAASPPSPAIKFWGERSAQQFEKDVLTKPNKFSAKASPNNPAQQANLFLRYANTVAPKLIKGAKNANAAKFAAKRYSDAYHMQKVAEKYFASKGLHPTFWDGSKVALTDVIDELGGPTKMTQEHMTQLITAFKNKNPEKIVNPEVRQAIENVRARDALQNAKWVRLALDQNSQKAAVADQVLSKGKYNQFVKDLISKNQRTMQMATDASPASINSTQHLLREILTRNGTLPQLATEAKKTYIQLYVTPESKKIKWLPVQAAQTNALSKVLGSNPAQLGKDLDQNNEAENWFMSRFATWYGNKDLRPEVLTKTAGALNNAAARAKIWNQVAKAHTPDEINEAFKIAQGHIQSPSSQKVTDLGAQFQKAMENLFASTGVKNEAQKAASVALRSGALIQDLNKQLKLVRSDFRFTQAKSVEDFMGNEHNYSKGADWLKSWELHEAKDPLDHIMRIETATEQLMHQYAFLDELGARYGSKIKSGVFSTPVAGRTKIGDNILGRLDGLYFPKELVPQVNKALDTWSSIYDPKSDLIKFLDKVTRTWKSGVTVYAPSHHIRNFIGDVYLSWLAGLNNPHAYTLAGRVIGSQRNRYKSLETINNLTDKNAVKLAMARPGDKVLTTKGGVDLTAEQIYIAAHSHGLLSHVNVIEDLIGDPLIKAQPFNGKVKDTVHAASELREHYVRVAHFVDGLLKSRGSNLPRIFKESANNVRKWHPDGMDLTKFEREKMKRIFPFYSWTRKTIPLLVESAVTRPGKINAYPRAMYALQGSLGIQSPGPTDPFPEDQLFPNWIKAKGIGPIMGGAGNYGIVNPSNPFNDVVSQFAGTGKPRDLISGLGSSLNPLARIPMEVGTGTSVLGQPIDQDLNRYATEQIPIASYLSRIGNMGITGPTNKAAKQGNFNKAALINLFTALGIQPTAPYIKEAQFEKKKGLQ